MWAPVLIDGIIAHATSQAVLGPYHAPIGIAGHGLAAGVVVNQYHSGGIVVGAGGVDGAPE